MVPQTFLLLDIWSKDNDLGGVTLFSIKSAPKIYYTQISVYSCLLLCFIAKQLVKMLSFKSFILFFGKVETRHDLRKSVSVFPFIFERNFILALKDLSTRELSTDVT